MPVKQEKNANVAFEDAMDIAGYGKFSMFIIILAGLAMCTSLLGSVDVSFILPAAECDLKLSSKDKGLLSSAFFIGIALLCIVNGIALLPMALCSGYNGYRKITGPSNVERGAILSLQAVRLPGRWWWFGSHL
ncbi:hypothetical protein J6590_082664 [Homalodisca vitripennis]|nr:hypothetical protein J6590_082664 [Homalodisca vitripennis]